MSCTNRFGPNKWHGEKEHRAYTRYSHVYDRGSCLSTERIIEIGICEL